MITVWRCPAPAAVVVPAPHRAHSHPGEECAPRRGVGCAHECSGLPAFRIKKRATHLPGHPVLVISTLVYEHQLLHKKNTRPRRCRHPSGYNKTTPQSDALLGMLYRLASTRFPSRLFTCSCPSPISKVWLLTSTSATMMRMCPVSRGGKTRLYNILVGGDQAKDEVAKKCSENVWEILCTGDLAGNSYLLAMICTDDRSEHERRCVQWETLPLDLSTLFSPCCL